MRSSVRLSMSLLASFLSAHLALSAEESLEQKKERAQRLYNTGYLMAEMGRTEEAILVLEESLRVLPTAEGYTYLGWTYSHLGDYKRAFEEAQKAIRIDPDFGNPYNDIGVYLIAMGKEDEAIPYLEKAMQAKRYCCYQFPHFNIGTIYLKKEMYERARQEFEKAIEIDPTYGPARKALEFLDRAGFKET